MVSLTHNPGFVQQGGTHFNTRLFMFFWYAVTASWGCAVYSLRAQVMYAAAAFVFPFVLRVVLQLWTHYRVYPYRNKLVGSHMLRALEKGGWMKAYIKAKRKLRILDFGCGMGDTSSILRSFLGQEADITSVDVYRSERWVGGPSKRMMYDGKTLPFDADAFDLAVCGQVLHHIPDNKRSLEEVCRTSKAALVVEDLVKRGTFQEGFCHFWDSLWNWDYFDNPPHTNRAHAEWLGLFEKNRMGVDYFHLTSFAFKKDAYVDDPSAVFATSPLANGLYVLKKTSMNVD